MDFDGRKRYRITPGEDHSLDVTVKTAEGTAFPGELLDITIEGAGTRFRRDAGPTLAVGQPATLTFTSVRLRKPISIRAKVRSRVEMGEFRSYRYGFEFDQWEELEGRLSREIHHLFNQRVVYRVEPDPVVEAVLRLPPEPPAGGQPDQETPAFEAAGPIKDLSAVGIAVLVDRAAEEAFATIDLVEIAFRLPTSSETLKLMGWIRHRQLKEDRVYYGLEFDPDRSARFDQQQHAIVRYVKRRQLEEPPRKIG